MSTTAPASPSLAEVLPSIREALDKGTAIACLPHRDADADSLGSALAFAGSLRSIGHDIRVVVPNPLPRMLSHLPGFDTASTDTPGPIDVLFAFDCATTGRFGDKRDLIRSTPIVVNVDHHVSNERFGTINLIDPTASATGQVVYHLLRSLGAPITADVATNLYAALFTDTGGFRHENTTEAALRLGADLVALGANAGWIALKSYKSRSVPQLKLEGLAVSRMRTELEGRLIWSEVTQQMLREAEAEDMQESEGIIDQLQSIDTMVLAVLFKESEGGTTKISVRSRDPVDATEVCRPFGGGGHRRAAGAELRAPLESAQARVLEVARQLVGRAQ